MYYTNRAGECITRTGRVNVLNVNRAGEYITRTGRVNVLNVKRAGGGGAEQKTHANTAGKHTKHTTCRKTAL